jgi:hypothetical protein
MTATITAAATRHLGFSSEQAMSLAQWEIMNSYDFESSSPASRMILTINGETG